ncbi:MAG: hypothetical protein ABSE20_30075 [Acetobacteraceae bacterium]
MQSNRQPGILVSEFQRLTNTGFSHHQTGGVHHPGPVRGDDAQVVFHRLAEIIGGDDGMPDRVIRSAPLSHLVLLAK